MYSYIKYLLANIYILLSLSLLFNDIIDGNVYSRLDTRLLLRSIVVRSG